MKKLNVVCIALLLVLTSCSSDDRARPSASIIGTWKVVSFVEDGTEMIENGDCDTLVTFTANTVSVEEFYGSTCNDTYPVETSPYTIEADFISGFGSEGYAYEITELSATTLEMQYFDEIENFVRVVIIMERQ